MRSHAHVVIHLRVLRSRPRRKSLLQKGQCHSSLTPAVLPYQPYRLRRFPHCRDTPRHDTESVGTSRFSRLKFPDMLWFYDSAVPLGRSPGRRQTCCLPHYRTRSTHESGDCGAQYTQPACTSHRCYTHEVAIIGVRIEDSVCEWLILHRRTLSFLTPNRFIPALSLSLFFDGPLRPRKVGQAPCTTSYFAS
jgi:hypothetical protein